MTSASEQKPLAQFNQGSALTLALLGDAIVNSEIKHGGGKGRIFLREPAVGKDGKHH